MSHFRELTVEQFEKLQALTEQIRGDQTKNYALGKALLEVKNLLMGTGIGFENYCKKHFNIAHAHVSRLMNYARVRDNIGMGNQNVYIPENTLRGLDRYSAEIQKQIWEEAKNIRQLPGIPTAAQVQEARRKLVSDPKEKQINDDCINEDEERNKVMLEFINIKNEVLSTALSEVSEKLNQVISTSPQLCWMHALPDDYGVSMLLAVTKTIEHELNNPSIATMKMMIDYATNPHTSSYTDKAFDLFIVSSIFKGISDFYYSRSKESEPTNQFISA